MDEALKQRLMDLGLSEEQITKLAGEGVATESDVTLLTASEVREATGCGLVTAKKVQAAFTPVVETPAGLLTAGSAGEAGSAGSTSSAQMFNLLPPLPDDVSFIESLKTGGVLKVGTVEVVSAVKAAFARRAGLFELPAKILAKMEAFAEAQEEPCGEQFYAMQRLLTERRYGEVLSVIGVTGSYISESRKYTFFERLEQRLWPAINGFQQQLVAWQQAWMQGAANPGALMLAMTASHAGGMLPPGMLQPPDTTPLRASAEEVVNEVNRIFSGPGIPVSRALAWDATRIMGILNEPTLPSQVGAGTREQMLKDLGITVGADLVRMEQGASRYTLAIMSLPSVPADTEYAYLGALINLGASIPWDKLASVPVEPPRRRRTGSNGTGLAGYRDEVDEEETPAADPFLRGTRRS